MNKQKVIWKILKSYFNEEYLERLVRHQIESYNYLVDTQIQNTINMFNPVLIRSENDFHPEFNKYDLITLWHSLEHMHNGDKVFSDITFER